MGPPPQCSGYILVIGVVVTSFHLGLSLFSCLVLGCTTPSGGGTIVGFGAQGRDPYSQETGQQYAVEDNMHCCVRRMGVHKWTDGSGRWAICSMLQHATCSDAHCVRVHMAGESGNKWRSEWECSQCADCVDVHVQVVWIVHSFGD